MTVKKVVRIASAAVFAMGTLVVMPLGMSGFAEATPEMCMNRLHIAGYDPGSEHNEACLLAAGGGTGYVMCIGMLQELGVTEDDATFACNAAND